MPSIELSVVMPCLNEAETVARCIEKAKLGFSKAGLRGEVIVADNGSTDGSQRLAEEHGARVVAIAAKGYGSALRGGIEAAEGEYIIMGDADDSYDFGESGKFVAKLREGYDLVMGCRLPSGGGTIAPGAMPWKNRYLGNPVLSFIGRLFFRTPVRDFHCGLRAFSRAAWQRILPATTGMEFATEMVMKASIEKLRIAEVPITLHKDGRSRPPHLRPWRDGWRHLRFMLIYSPRWLFLVPGLVLALGGAAAAASFYLEPVGGVADAQPILGGLALACAAAISGVQLVACAFYTKVFGTSEGLLPEDRRFTRIFRYFTLERGLLAGVGLFLAGLGLLILSFARGRHPEFSVAGNSLAPLPAAFYLVRLREVIAAAGLLVLGVQVVFSSFFMSVLGLKTVHRHPPDPAGLE